MRCAMATVNTPMGEMTVYYNGAYEYLTAENADTVKAFGRRPCGVYDAVAIMQNLSAFDFWDPDEIDPKASDEDLLNVEWFDDFNEDEIAEAAAREDEE